MRIGYHYKVGEYFSRFGKYYANRADDFFIDAR